MKRFMPVLLIVSLLISFSSCGNKAENVETKSYTKSHTETVDNTETDMLIDTEDTTAASQTAAFFETSSASQQTNDNYSLDDKELYLLNLFLSNFSELYSGRRENYYIDNTTNEKMLNFVILSTYFNYNKNFSYGYFEYNGKEYQAKVSASYVQERVKRYFDVNVPDASTDSFYFDGDYYYYPAADGEFFPYFSKVTSVTQNYDGTLKAEFNIYFDDSGYDNILDNTSSKYYGYGDENIANSVKIGYGQALLKEKYFGEDYGNYTVISLDMNYQNDSR